MKTSGASAAFHCRIALLDCFMNSEMNVCSWSYCSYAALSRLRSRSPKGSTKLCMVYFDSFLRWNLNAEEAIILSVVVLACTRLWMYSLRDFCAAD